MSDQKELLNETSEVNVEEEVRPEEAEHTEEITEEREGEAHPSEPETEEESTEEEVQSGEDAEELETQIANLKKHDAAVLLIKKAKNMVQDAETEMETCKLLLSDDLKEFDAAKESLKKGGLEESEALLEALDFASEEGETVEEEGTLFESKEEVAPIYIREVSSGKFTSFLLALIIGAVTLAGVVFAMAKKLGVALDPSKMPSKETCDTILSGIGGLIGHPDPMIGGAMAGATVLLVMWIVYAIRVSSKAGSNLEFAKAQLKEAEEYAVLKGNCKEEMDKVDAHIKEAVKVMQTYEVLLNEQEAKLKRILYLEKADNEEAEYHEKSRKEMEESAELIESIKTFINTPLAEEGKLSGKSTLFLYRAKNRLDKAIERLY
jgi:hypothetical protein